MKPDIIDTVLARLSKGPTERLPAPKYTPPSYAADYTTHPKIGMAVESMRRHTTDEGYQLFMALASAGYDICGKGFIGTAKNPGWVHAGITDCREVLRMNPCTVVLQDKREWEGRTAGPGFDERERFTHVSSLSFREDVFKLTILKDASLLCNHYSLLL